MTATMTPPSSGFRTGPRSRFTTPLLADGLLDPGTIIAPDQLRRRILSHFWRDCCLPSCFSRAPAPVVEVASETPPAETEAPRLIAWWLLPDGIVEDNLGPYSERLRPFFGDLGRIGQLWPRYQFCIAGVGGAQGEALVELTIYSDPMVIRRQRVSLATEPGGALRVVAWQPVTKT